MTPALDCRGLLAVLVALTLAACSSAEDAVEGPGDGSGEPELAATFTLTPPVPTTGEEVTLDARGITCAAAPCGYLWEDVTRGRSTLGEGVVLTLAFEGEGMKSVRLTVTDAVGSVATHHTDVEVFAAGFTRVPRPTAPSPPTSPREGDGRKPSTPAGGADGRVVRLPVQIGDRHFMLQERGRP